MIQVNVINDPHGQGFQHALYGEQIQNNVSFFRDQYQSLMQNSAGLLPVGFLNNVTNHFNVLNSEEAARAARNAMLQSSHLLSSTAIRFLQTPAELMAAPISMIPYLMAVPEIRKMYLQQRIDGYADAYVNVHGNAMGRFHEDYRVLYDGVVQFNEDGSWYADQLPHEDPNGTVLSHQDKMAIIGSADFAIQYMREMGSDVTNPLGGDVH